MARKPRFSPGGLAYHVMNRASVKIDLFDDAGDYDAFERVLAEAIKREASMRVCAYCLMPNHFHLVLWPKVDGQLSRFMQWLTMTHTQRWHAHRHSEGRGHLYQGRFKSFPIQENSHFLTVCRYVERNPLRANLAEKSEDWRWSSMSVRAKNPSAITGLLADWPVAMPRDWLNRVNAPQDEKELAALRLSRDRGRPFGDPSWTTKTAKRLEIESSLQPLGRPKKSGSAEKNDS
jgi:putative transposase